MRATIDYRTKSLVVRQVRKNPYLGVRQIARFLKEKYGLSISKSSVAGIIKSKGIENKRGRKEEALLYNRQTIRDCGLFLLKAIDSYVGLSDALTEELKLYFPRLNSPWLKKIILFSAFSGLIGGSYEKNAKRNGFLRLADMYVYPVRKLRYFYGRLSNYKPVVSLGNVQNNAELISTVKFSFENNTASFLDAKMATFWDSPCNLTAFFAPLYWVKERLLRMFKDRAIYVNYTKSFDYLSPSVVNFIEALRAGIKRVDFLSPQNKVLESLPGESLKPSFLVGYYPKIFTKAVIFLEKEKRFKKLTVLDDIFYTAILTRFAQAKTTKGVILNNLLIKFKENSAASWGLLSDRRTNLEPFLQKYLLFFPYTEKTFLEEMKVIESSFFSREEKKDLCKFVPAVISLENESDCVKIADILYSLFKEEVGTLDLKEKAGQLSLGKDYCRIILKDTPASIKRKFNALCFYLGTKRVFVV